MSKEDYRPNNPEANNLEDKPPVTKLFLSAKRYEQIPGEQEFWTIRALEIIRKTTYDLGLPFEKAFDKASQEATKLGKELGIFNKDKTKIDPLVVIILIYIGKELGKLGKEIISDNFLIAEIIQKLRELEVFDEKTSQFSDTENAWKWVTFCLERGSYLNKFKNLSEQSSSNNFYNFLRTAANRIRNLLTNLFQEPRRL
ncbi:MAG: hypothetical protein NZM02_02395 [Patescibacteria group bacterium]|nr:hypothetical protein [Patescibacteria group bacterium]